LCPTFTWRSRLGNKAITGAAAVAQVSGRTAKTAFDIAARTGRGAMETFCHTAAPEMVPVVAAEKLVSAVAGKGDRHVPGAPAGTPGMSDLRGIRERLVVDRRKARNDVSRLRGGHVQLGVLGAQVSRHRACVRRLVVATFVESDAEGLLQNRDCDCISAVTVEESIPPERNAPSGTSAIICPATEARSRRSNSSAASSSVSGRRSPDPLQVVARTSR